MLLTTASTSADHFFPLFDRYGKVVDICIPRDRRMRESRGFAFVQHKYVDEAQKAIERQDGRNVDGREIGVLYAKYGPNGEAIFQGRISQGSPRRKAASRSRSRNPGPGRGSGYLNVYPLGDAIEKIGEVKNIFCFTPLQAKVSSAISSVLTMPLCRKQQSEVLNFCTGFLLQICHVKNGGLFPRYFL